MSLGKATAFEQHVSTQGVSPREVFFRYVPYAPWIILSLILSLVFSYVKLRYEHKIYAVNSTMMVREPDEGRMKSDKIEEMLFNTSEKNINDEIQVIKTSHIAMRVVKSLGLQLLYFNKGSILTSMINPSESPFRMQILELPDTLKKFDLNINILDEERFQFGEKGKIQKFNEPFTTERGKFLILRKPISLKNYVTNEFLVTYASIPERGQEMLSYLNALPSGESTNIMRLILEIEAPGLGVDILNQWMAEYQKSGFDEKKKSNTYALDFIDEQLNAATKELSFVEKDLKNFRQRNLLLDPESQSQTMISALKDLEEEITARSIQLQLVDNLISYISDTKNPYRQVGSMLSVEEPTLASQIMEFNKLQVQRATMLPTTPRSNPMMISLETAIEKLRQDILQNLQNVKQGYGIGVESLKERNNSANRIMSRMPEQQRELLEITRRQKILEGLYQILLEKKLETAISSAATVSNVVVLEPASSSQLPIRPNRQGTYMLAVLIGLGIPAFVAFLMEYLNDKVRSRQDVVSSTQAPIIGEIGHSAIGEALVVRASSRKFISEQFKIIRTNLQYIIPEKDKIVVLVTSSTSGEGKSFIATNVGAVIALSGKKTAILEFDIRKPKILSGLGMTKQKGVTNYIIGSIPFEDLIVPVPGIENLDVIPCGPIPPNPSELLLDDRLNAFLQKIKDHYEAVVIDTAPVGLVSDAMVIGKHADVSLYVVRHNYTYRKQLQLMDEIYSSKRLPRLSILLNDIQAQAGSYGSYYGYGGYGYGNYGYGYGKDYFDKDKRKKSKKPAGFLQRIFRNG